MNRRLVAALVAAHAPLAVASPANANDIAPAASGSSVDAPDPSATAPPAPAPAADPPTAAPVTEVPVAAAPAPPPTPPAPTTEPTTTKTPPAGTTPPRAAGSNGQPTTGAATVEPQTPPPAGAPPTAPRPPADATSSRPDDALDEPNRRRTSVPNFLIDQFRIPPFLLSIYQAAGIEYGIRWEVLAAINEIETDYGRNLNVSTAGALGWMQFMPATWKAYGVDANRDGERDPYNPVDAIFAAARYLRAAGAEQNLRKAIFAYNHADWYVNSVLARARRIAALPEDLISSLAGLTQGLPPLAGPLDYDGALDLSNPTRTPRESEVDDDTRSAEGLEIRGEPGAAVAAVADGTIIAVGGTARSGYRVTLRDVWGNTYSYRGLASRQDQVPVPIPQKTTEAERHNHEHETPIASDTDPEPTTPASATPRELAEPDAAEPDAAEPDAADAPETGEPSPDTPDAPPTSDDTLAPELTAAERAAMRRQSARNLPEPADVPAVDEVDLPPLPAAVAAADQAAETLPLTAPAEVRGDGVAPLRPAPAPLPLRPKAQAPTKTEAQLQGYLERLTNGVVGGSDQVVAADPGLPAGATFGRYFTVDYGLGKDEVQMRPLRAGRRVIAGTILGHLKGGGGTLPDGPTATMRLAIRPAGEGAPTIDPKPIVDGWRLLDRASVYRARGRDGLFTGNASVGQILLMDKQTLQRRVLANPDISIYECGRRDIRAGVIDRRVLATLEFLAANGMKPTVSSLKCGHSYYTASGNVSHHTTGTAFDIAAINGAPILGNQGADSVTDRVVRKLLTLQGAMKPAQIITLMKYPGTDNTFAMGDHADHIHIGWSPTAQQQRGAGRPRATLKPGQWSKLLQRLDGIENPEIPLRPSKYALSAPETTPAQKKRKRR